MTGRYRHLRLDEREMLSRMKNAKVPVSQMATRLGRHPSTIYRELRRNHFFDDDAYFRGYFGSVAHDKARRRRQCGGKVTRNPRLAAYIGLHVIFAPKVTLRKLPKFNGLRSVSVSISLIVPVGI